MKTPEEIKKGLNFCTTECFGHNENCPYRSDPSECVLHLCTDALAYIQQLESRLAQAERERDAAVNDLPHHCWNCAYHRDYPIEEIDTGGRTIHRYCDADYCFPDDNSSWQWRGVCPENTKEAAST